MPISSRARKREGSETRAQARRPRARSKHLTPTKLWGEDIVQSVRKRAAVQRAFKGHLPKAKPRRSTEISSTANTLYGARLAISREYIDLGGFGLVHTDALNARIVMWDSAA